MTKLKAKKSISKYKTKTRTVYYVDKENKIKSKQKKDKVSAWLDSVYRGNKEYIDQRIGESNTTVTTTPKQIFKQLVYENIEAGMTPNQALKTLNKSTVFVPVQERLSQNAYSALKDDPQAYKAFREATKINGRYTKVDMGEFKWDKYQKVYRYGDTIISFRNSPYEVILTKANTI